MRRPWPPANTNPVNICAVIIAGLTPDVAHFNFELIPTLLATLFRITIIAPCPHVVDELRNLVIGCASAQQRAYIVPLGTEQAQKEFALGRQAQASTITAKWLRYAGNQADFTLAICITVAAGYLAAIFGCHRL